MRMHRTAGAMAALLGLALVVACSKSDDETGSSPTGSTSSWISDVSILSGASATYTGTVPPAATGGPAVTLSGSQVVVNGATSQVTVSSTEAFAKLYVFVQGLSGYYEAPLAAPATSAKLVVSYLQKLPGGTFTFAVSAVSASGAVGTPTTIATTVRTVETGDLQISLSWNSGSDVDLHVVEPSGEEIYWNNRLSASGGALNLDSNATCVQDAVRAENVTWTKAPPSGTYVVRVDLWSSCGTSASSYVVRVNQASGTTTYTGTLTGSGDEGGRGSGVTVATFTR